MTREFRLLTLGLLAADSVTLATAWGLAYLLRYGGLWPIEHTEPAVSSVVFPALMPVASLTLFWALGLYDLDRLFAGHREYEAVAQGCTYAAFGVLVLSFLTATTVARGAIVAAWVLSIVLVGVQRFALRRVIFRLRARGHLVRRLLIVGTDDHAVAIARQLHRARESGYQVAGFLDDYRPVGMDILEGLQVLGDPRRAREIAAACGASGVVMVPDAVSWESQRELLELAASDDGPAMQLAPGLYHVLATGIRTTDNGLVPLVVLGWLRITGLDALLKTAIDYVGAILLLAALGPVVALCVLARLVDGAGPLCQRQRVLGLRGRPFHLMVMARPVAPEPSQPLRRWAWRLRLAVATSRLGKLPNLLNVLRGRMSLVGPRALAESDGAARESWTHNVLLVRPGLTGPAAGPNGLSSPEEQAIKDVAYVRDYSLWLDLRLLFASFKRMMRREEGLPPSYGSLRGEEALSPEVPTP
jgi:lipopolysaccharide/colanic/teichoic acid biosynthesis glycosyltransferase